MIASSIDQFKRDIIIEKVSKNIELGSDGTFIDLIILNCDRLWYDDFKLMLACFLK